MTYDIWWRVARALSTFGVFAVSVVITLGENPSIRDLALLVMLSFGALTSQIAETKLPTTKPSTEVK